MFGPCCLQPHSSVQMTTFTSSEVSFKVVIVVDNSTMDFPVTVPQVESVSTSLFSYLLIGLKVFNVTERTVIWRQPQNFNSCCLLPQEQIIQTGQDS